jgi:hypothetical protein
MVSNTLNVGLILIESFEFMFEEEINIIREPFIEIWRDGLGFNTGFYLILL